MRFTKMQGCGNDYIYVNAMEERVESPGRLAKAAAVYRDDLGRWISV